MTVVGGVILNNKNDSKVGRCGQKEVSVCERCSQDDSAVQNKRQNNKQRAWKVFPVMFLCQKRKTFQKRNLISFLQYFSLYEIKNVLLSIFFIFIQKYFFVVKTKMFIFPLLLFWESQTN